MNTSQRLLWNIYAGVVATVATVVAQKAVTAAWELATGDQPPEPNDPDVPLRRALSWAVASGVGIGLTQLLLNRFAAKRWAQAMGAKAPAFSKTRVTI